MEVQANAMPEFRPYPKPEPRKKKRRSDLNLSNWRAEVMGMYRYRCGACNKASRRLTGEGLEAHHLILRSRSGDAYVDDPRNGIALCGPWMNDCHAKVHRGQLKIQRLWLTQASLDCLTEQKLEWIDGVPYGPSSNYFAAEEHNMPVEALYDRNRRRDDGSRGAGDPRLC